MADHQGQGHHKGESPYATLKKAFGWEHQPKFFKNPFFLGFLGSLLIGVTLLNDRILPSVELSKRDMEYRIEEMEREKDRLKLEQLKLKDPSLRVTLEGLKAQEDMHASNAKSNKPL